MQSIIEAMTAAAVEADERAWDMLVEEFGEDRVQQNLDPSRFVSEFEMTAADVADLEAEMAARHEFEAAMEV